MDNKTVSKEDYVLEVMQQEFAKDIAAKNRTIAELRADLQLAVQELRQYKGDAE